MCPSDQRSLGTDAVCSLLENSRRRTLLSVVLETDAETDEELARRVAARERNRPLADVSDDVRDRVYVALVHNHLPRLADHDVLEYDRATGTVEPDDAIEELEPLVVGSTDVADAGVSLQFSHS